MIPAPMDLLEIARRREGNLADVPFAVLLRALAESRRTAVVRLSRGPLEKEVIFDDGVPVECESNLLHENLGRVLVAQGKLSEEHYQRALSTAAAQERSLAEALISLQLISSYDLFRVMQQSLAHKLLDVFAWRDGTFRVLAETPEVESPLRVNVGQLVVTGVLRFAPQAQVDTAIGGLVGHVLGVHPTPPTPLSSLRLHTKHSRALQHLRGRLRLDELMARAGLTPDEVTRLVYALAVLGVVAPVQDLPAAEPSPAAAPAVAVVSTAAPAAPRAAEEAAPPATAMAVADAAARDALMALYMRHRRGDAFDLLEVPTDVDPARLVAAYVRAAEVAAPWRFAGPAYAGLAEKAEELFLSLARAWAELSDGEARARVVERRRRATAGPAKKRSDIYAIKTDLLDAAAQFKQGQRLKDEGHYARALPLLEFAADCDAQNASYRAEVAHCRYLDAPQAQARRSLEDLAAALRMDPQCVSAALYASQIHLGSGDLVRARAALQDAVRIAPQDARVKKAARELSG